MSESIRRVSTIFTIDDSSHNQKLKSINQQYKLTQSEIKLAGERMQGFGKNTDDLKFKQSALEKQVVTLREKSNHYSESIERATKKADENKNKLDELKASKVKLTAEYREAVKMYGKESEQAQALKGELDGLNGEIQEQERVVNKNVDSVNRYTTEMNKTEAQLAGVQAELNKTNTELEKAQNKWLVAGEKMKEAGKKLQSTGDTMKKTGSSLNKYVTLPLTAMGTIAAREAIKFESSFTGVKKTVDGTTEQMAKLEQGIIDMSKEIPATTHEIAAVAEAAGQLGIEVDNIENFTRVVIDLGEATNIVGDEGAAAMAKFANITQMSQKDFDRFGSTIVDLGNNTATTERDILNMAMRLAASGAQAGISEPKILGIAAALSSVGIEAEAGGSAWSKFTNNVQLAVETNSKKLSDFARVAGMSASDFKKAWEEDAASALVAFTVGLQDTERHGKSAVQILDEMDIKEVRLRDTLLRAAGAGDLFNETILIGSKAWEENTALTKEANQRYATTESQLKIMKNEIAEAARSLGVELLPIIKDTIPTITDMVKAFANLSPQTKENIIKFGLLAAAAGPVLRVGGSLVGGAGRMLEVGGKLTTMLAGGKGLTAATSGLGGAAATAGGTTGVGALTTGLGGILTTAAPVAVAIGTIGLAGYALHKGLSQEVIPTVDLFADHVGATTVSVEDSHGNLRTSIETTTTKISEETQKQLGAYLELSEELQNTTHNMYMGLEEDTEKTTNKITGDIEKMSTDIIEATKNQTGEVTKDYETLFNNTTVITEEEKTQILKSVSEGHIDRIKKTEDLRDELLEIYEDIKKQSGRVTEDQQKRINEIIEDMKKQAVETMTQNEAEQNVILNRLSGSTERITAEMVGNTIKQLEDQRKETLKIAGEERDDLVRTAENLKTQEGGKWADKADEIIKEANRQYEETAKAADKTKKQGIEKLEDAYGNLTKEVDQNTGKILTFWDKVKNWWNNWTPKSKNTVMTTTQHTNYTQSGTKPYALGTSHSLGGLAQVHERGYEMIDLPVGSRVRNHLSSSQMAEEISKKTAINVAKEILGSLNIDRQLNVFLDKEKIGEIMVPVVDKGIGFQTDKQDWALGGA